MSDFGFVYKHRYFPNEFTKKKLIKDAFYYRYSIYTSELSSTQ